MRSENYTKNALIASTISLILATGVFYIAQTYLKPVERTLNQTQTAENSINQKSDNYEYMLSVYETAKESNSPEVEELDLRLQYVEEVIKASDWNTLEYGSKVPITLEKPSRVDMVIVNSDTNLYRAYTADRSSAEKVIILNPAKTQSMVLKSVVDLSGSTYLGYLTESSNLNYLQNVSIKSKSQLPTSLDDLSSSNFIGVELHFSNGVLTKEITY